MVWSSRLGRGFVADETGVEYVVTEHEMRLFAREECRQLFRAAGLSVETADSAMPGRDRYIGRPGAPTSKSE